MKYFLSKKTPQNDSDEQWIKKIRKGDEKAFEELFLFYYSKLCRFSCSIINSPFLAEEIVQEVFAHIWEKRKTLDCSENIQALLYIAVKNKTYDWIEKRNIERKYLDKFVLQQPAEDDESNEQEDSDFIREAQKAIENLPDRAKMVYKLHKTEGLTYPEIASVMEISVKTVESQMGRALKLIRLQMAKVTELYS